MNRPFIYFLSITLAIYVAMYSFLSLAKPKSFQIANMGVTDLRNHNFETDSYVSLLGEWAFYWDRAVSEETYDSIINQTPDAYASVPSYWDELSRIDSKIKPLGVVTYSLTILKDFERENDVFAIRIRNITPNADIYVDGKKICEIGNVDSNPEKSVAANRNLLIPVEARGNSMTIAISISNYHNVNGGLNRVISFGPYKELLALRGKLLAIDSIFLGCLFLMALYQFSVLILRRRRITPLYLGLLALFSLLFAGLKGEMALLTIFPNWDGMFRAKIIFFLFSLVGPVFTLYCFNLYPSHFHSKLRIIVIPIAFVLLVASVVTPTEIYSRFILPLKLIMTSFIGYTFFMLVRALYITKNGLIMLTLFGMEFLIFSIVLGIVDNESQTVFQSISGAFFIFGVYQTVLEAKIFSNTLLQVDKLSTERTKLEKQNVDFFTQIFIDGKTGMYNRVMLEDLLQSEWTADKLGKGHPISMIIANVDYFGFYRSAYGYEQSENMMTQLSQVVSQSVTHMKNQVPIRYDEDTFAVVLFDIDEFSLYRIADKLRISVESRNIEHKFAGILKVLTISVGCGTITPSRDNSPGTLINLAKKALKLAKRNGRNRVEIIKKT